MVMKKNLILFVFLLCFGLCDCLQKEGTKYNSQASNHLKNILDSAYRDNQINYSNQIIMCIKQAILSGGNPNIVSAKTHRSALSFAIEFRDSKFLNFLIENGLTANVTDKDGNPILLSAIRNVRILQLLLRAGAAPNRTNSEKQTPLMAACMHPSTMTLDSVDTLLNANADVFVQDNNGDTVLHLAVRTDWCALVMRFFKPTNAPPCGNQLKFITNKNGITPLDIARINGNHGLLSLMQMKPEKLK